MNITCENQIKESVVERFIRYAKVYTTSDENGIKNPTSNNQYDLAELLKEELIALGLINVEVDDCCYVYATLPASKNVNGTPISFISHMDTSPAVTGENVKPIIHKNYKGDDLTYPDDETLTLSPKECPYLLDYIGDDIITASGISLLGADDKAGIAEIMTALEILINSDDIQHPELRICFTPDEEVGRGADSIDVNKLGKYAYTIDGGQIGELEDECFNAHGVEIVFTGKNVHPGSAKNLLINACKIASEFVTSLPANESPEHTEKREGFYHLSSISGNESQAKASLIIRDFDAAKNKSRIDFINSLQETFLIKYPGLIIDVTVKESYRNMNEVLKEVPQVVEKASNAMKDFDIKVLRTPIRGGTDGARLSFMGLPTPNIFTGGFLFHSKKEWIPVSSMVKAVQVIVRLAESWC